LSITPIREKQKYKKRWERNGRKLTQGETKDKK
jgi:hypothetical protein